jgi:excisionase family DNA binding protein
MMCFTEPIGRGVIIGMGTQELLTTAEAAEILRMRPDSLSRKIKRGEIAAVKVGKQWLIRKDTLDTLLQPPAPQG